MANILSVDDSTFAGGVGNWKGNVTPEATLSTAATPTSPDGNNVLKLAKPSNGFLAMDARIPTAKYPTSTGQYHSLDFAFNVPGTNTGTGELECYAWIVLYRSTGSGGDGYGNFVSAPFNPGDGWHTLGGNIVVPSSFDPYVWVGVIASFRPVINSSPHGFATGDLAYLSDVELTDAPPVAAGGWGVGMVRMGGN